MSYRDKGYNEYFQRSFGPEDKIPDLTRYDVDSHIEGIPAGLLDGGIISSKDGKLILNLETGEISYDGTSLV